jgi:hypothetical protein
MVIFKTPTVREWGCSLEDPYIKVYLLNRKFSVKTLGDRGAK